MYRDQLLWAILQLLWVTLSHVLYRLTMVWLLKVSVTSANADVDVTKACSHVSCRNDEEVLLN